MEPTRPVQPARSQRSPRRTFATADAAVWTAERVHALKKAVKHTKREGFETPKLRWKAVAAKVGGGVDYRRCKDKYHELQQAQTSESNAAADENKHEQRHTDRFETEPKAAEEADTEMYKGKLEQGGKAAEAAESNGCANTKLKYNDHKSSTPSAPLIGALIAITWLM